MRMSVTERVRSLFQEPFSAVREMGVTEGQKVADLGAGKGFFTIPAALTVGKAGVVYSVEPDSTRSDKIRARVKDEGLDNVFVLTAKAERLDGIPSGSVDLAFSAFSAHHFEDRASALSEVRRILREGGQFYVWDVGRGLLTRHGTSPQELGEMAEGFARVEMLQAKRTVRARFTK